ncbi:MAG: B12-binding domain-containing radical SAM protein [Nitrospirae bacterium]|nr:B12-binding domain-containing radical SAM protein [Nitrospirota bacterium]
MKNGIHILLMTSKSGPGWNLAPPLGLYRLKNYVEKDNIHCDILDYDIDADNTYLQRAGQGYYDVIGMSVSHINMVDDLDVILRFHHAASQSTKRPIIIAGGQAATLNYQQWLSSGLIDVIFLGFAEEALLGFCRNLLNSGNTGDFSPAAESVEGVVFTNKEGIMVHKPSPILTKDAFRKLSFSNIIDADLPYERYWEKVNAEKIDGISHTGFIFETVRLYTTSHCPRKCGFCSSQSFLSDSQGRQTPIIMLSAGEVFELVLKHIDKYGARGFLFSDDNFLAGNKEGLERVNTFCNLVIEAKQSGRISEGVKFFCQSRVADYIKNGDVRWDLMKTMKRAGFDNTGLGIESFSPRLLKFPSINKVGVTVEDYKMVLNAMLETGIVPIIFIIVGIPESTEEELVETMYTAVDYIRRGADVSVTPRLRANPGSPICKRGEYKLSYKHWKNPDNGNELAIEDYFIPQNNNIAGIIDEIHLCADKEIQRIKIEKGLTKSIVPKLLLGLATFIATAKLIKRRDVADDFTKIVNEMLGPSVAGSNDDGR